MKEFLNGLEGKHDAASLLSSCVVFEYLYHIVHRAGKVGAKMTTYGTGAGSQRTSGSHMCACR